MKKLALVAVAALAACSAPQQGNPRDTGHSDASDVKAADAKDASVEATDAAADAPRNWVKPAGAVAIRFKVDDSANGTYQGGQMRWTGSFKWSDADNTIVPATAWLPTDGPFPPLFDDGPMSQGGHEPETATKGDHVFECEVWFTPDAAKDTLFEYGLLDEDDDWIWVGRNGQFVVAAGATLDQDVKGLVIPKFGSVDFEVTVDLSSLDAAFSTITPTTHNVYVKSSANSWVPVQLLDDGKGGDAKAGDEVYTYQHSRHLGTHDGLLADGRHVQFVFVFAMEGQNPLDGDGVEYKVASGDCATSGVKGYLDAATPGTFAEQAVIMEMESRGGGFNTAMIVGAGGAFCSKDSDCWGQSVDETITCDTTTGECPTDIKPPVKSKPAVKLVDPIAGPTAGGTAVTLTGEDFRAGASVLFGDVPATDVQLTGATSIACKTPAHAAGKVTVKVANTDGGSAEYSTKFEFVEPPPTGPVIDSVTPAFAPTIGGQVSVTISGSNFADGDKVLLGDQELTAIVIDAHTIHVAPTAHAMGVVDVQVTGTDGKSGKKTGAFSFVTKGTPTMDGAIGADWDASWQASKTSVAADWGAGNSLTELWTAYDDTYLYVGIKGTCEAAKNNAIVAWIDTDFGASTGVKDMTKLTDDSSGLDAAVSSGLVVSVAGFGAEEAVGTIAMKSVASDTAWPDTANAGWRGLSMSKPDDFSWDPGEVTADATAGVVEARIKLADLFRGAQPANGAVLAFVVRVVDGTGMSASAQCLPPLATSTKPLDADAVAVVPLGW